MRPKISKNTSNINPKVYQLAQIFYKEFELMHDVYGGESYKRIVSVVIQFLEEMDCMITEKQKIELSFNLTVAEKNELVVQFERERKLHLASKNVSFILFNIVMLICSVSIY